MNKFKKYIIASAIYQPLKTIFNEKFKARSIAMTQSILCSSMILYCILGTNGMDDSPNNMIHKTISFQSRQYFMTKIQPITVLVQTESNGILKF